MGSESTPKKDPLDTFIAIGAQVEKAIGIWLPQAQMGLALVRTLVSLWNQHRQPSDPPIELPSDADLIQRLRERAKRIEDTSTKWLDDLAAEQDAEPGGQG